ncbi:hypothetical protein AB3Z07_02715 [Metabacillus halosaccharovorans]|uniref:hypothetical protein n=1 Tax=Metabacillus halosaccharovorans TaxID=930124 RepID=UPI0034CDAB90
MAEVVHSYGCNHPNWNGTIVYPYDAVHRSYLRGKKLSIEIAPMLIIYICDVILIQRPNNDFEGSLKNTIIG